MSTQRVSHSKSVYCLLCGNREKCVSYHAFPKQKEIRQRWIQFCGIKEHILNTATRLCSNHFCEELKTKRGKGFVLHPNAVPSIHTTKDGKRKQCILTDKGNIDYNAAVIGPSKMTAAECTQDIAESAPLDDFDSSATAIEDIYNRSSTSATDKATVCSNSQTPIKLNQNPRFVSEIRTRHLVTPRKAQLAKWTIAQQNRKIKTLQQARNRLAARVTTMKKLIKHLRQMNYDAVKYIRGFMVRKLIWQRICRTCSNILIANPSNSTLINLKNRGNK